MPPSPISALLCRRAPASAIALTVVTTDTLPRWLTGQSPAVHAWLEANGFTGKAGERILIPSKDGTPARIVAGISRPVSLWDLAALPASLQGGVYVLEGIRSAKEEEALALGWLLGAKTLGPHGKKTGEEAVLCLSKTTKIAELLHLAEVIRDTRALITAPAQAMGPQELAAAVVEAGKQHGAKTILTIGDDLLKKHYPATHAVGRASARAPRLIDLTWGNPKHPRVTLIGKGVCFDTGGLDLKTSSGMFLMRKDMAGAAIALGLARLVMQKKLRVRLRLIIPAVDNAIGQEAYRPSDILRMRNGTTVEVGNTDAEGRLIVADALLAAAEEKPDLIIDIATLGAARGIFGSDISGFYTHDDTLARAFENAGRETEDPVWRLPLHEPYKAKLATPFADINSSPASASMGLLTAGTFLDRFLEPTQRCLHIDCLAWNMGGRAGRPEGGEAMALRAVAALLDKLYATR